MIVNSLGSAFMMCHLGHIGLQNNANICVMLNDFSFKPVLKELATSHLAHLEKFSLITL